MLLIRAFQRKLDSPVDILPLAVFRIAFGMLMLFSSVRFVLNGWVDAIYIQPKFHFSYLGFAWLQPLAGEPMLLVYAALIILALLIMIGLAYRISILLFFLLFTAVELIDQATYLNHYYFISLISFLLIFLPANRALSLDVLLHRRLWRPYVPYWCIFVLKLQLALVYFFAGFAKLNADWLLHGLPMGIWLKGNTDMPIIGSIFDYAWVALAMSWAGAFYDLTIPIWLAWRKTRLIAYLTVIVFHLTTAMLFPIGVFPWVMIASTLVFFSGDDFRSILRGAGRVIAALPRKPYSATPRLTTRVAVILMAFFVLQLVMPLRHYLYPGDVNWTMEGYRFAWRVLLNEKAGFATFYVVDHTLGRRQVVLASDHLTEQQARHMAYQPDMILQFAHYLGENNPFNPQHDIAVYAEVYVSHNGRPSKLLVNPRQNLLEVPRDIFSNDWVLRY